MALLGIKYPFGKSTDGLPAPSTDDLTIKDSLTQLVLTAKGERVMRPDLGTNIRNYIFDSGGEFTAQLIDLELRSVIGRYEPRVIVTEVVLSTSDTTMSIDIHYVLASSGASDKVSVAVPVAV